MARTKLVNGKRFPLTVTEETQRDEEESTWEPTIPETELQMVERFLTTDPVKRREIAEMADHRGVTPRSIVDKILAKL